MASQNSQLSRQKRRVLGSRCADLAFSSPNGVFLNQMNFSRKQLYGRSIWYCISELFPIPRYCGIYIPSTWCVSSSEIDKCHRTRQGTKKVDWRSNNHLAEKSEHHRRKRIRIDRIKQSMALPIDSTKSKLAFTHLAIVAIPRSKCRSYIRPPGLHSQVPLQSAVLPLSIWK